MVRSKLNKEVFYTRRNARESTRPVRAFRPVFFTSRAALVQVVEQWYRVEYPGGVRLRASPSFDHTDPSLGVLVCGWVFLATRRYRAPGSSHLFLQVSTIY